ncbi:MAG TPA: bifunctional adenosylcobinamide kinase/adenosylcobinamide-phosphate guanylyltransferase [Verrucomicrobiae bacterium]|nr:bifunctional adenosylcobinamide kinase/adenosylcobinamide-phosphate guanylyltransferase [Verrucomicrobiae bacterium]
MGKLILVTGAARSGKSIFAEKLAASFGKEVKYFATAQAFDAEMEERIRLHQASRPQAWSTVEEPIHLPEKFAEWQNFGGVILLDCLTLWLSNLLLSEEYAEGEAYGECVQRILNRVDCLVTHAMAGEATVVMVSNEVGWSLVPENKLGRMYRDLAGKANQLVARDADKVYLVVAGCPVEIKGPGSKIWAEIGV